VSIAIPIVKVLIVKAFLILSHLGLDGSHPAYA
jgi:hypothetical protein